MQHQPDELHREADPEEDVKLDQTLEDLVARKHLLDPSVGSEELVDLPAELLVYFPTESNVSQFRHGNDDRKYGGNGADRDGRDSL